MHWLNRRVSRSYRRGARLGRLVLLLTTTGRKTGLPRTTPLQYEMVDGVIYVASARGQAADWFRNVVANPCVTVQIEDEQFAALAEPVTDPARIAGFLELRLQRHPIMLRLMLAAEGLPPWFDRVALERFAAGKALVAMRRIEPGGDARRVREESPSTRRPENESPYRRVISNPVAGARRYAERRPPCRRTQAMSKPQTPTRRVSTNEAAGRSAAGRSGTSQPCCQARRQSCTS